MLRQRHLRDRLAYLVAPAALVGAVAVAVVGSGSGGGFVALALLGLLVVAVGWAVLVGRSIIASIDDLTEATTTLARSQGRLATEDLSPEALPQLDGTETGPLGALATTIDGLGRAVVDAAQVQRENVRKGLATMVINLARRNQSLLDRQVELLDELEQSEEDAERLDQLFRIDHLSTRMRRNAESLLVLAGSESGRRRGAPVPIVDVLRVAIGEVEQYQRIELGRVDDGMVPAGAAVDLAHMTAELMENATQFSPPSTAVEVQAAIDRRNGMYMIAVVDRGTGLGERLEVANRTIAEPPELGLDMGRSLGFMVVGRLARRLGASIRLRPNSQGGTVAVIAVPLSKLVSGPAAEPGAAPTAEAEAEAQRSVEAAPATEASGGPVPPAAPGPPPGAPVSTNLEKLLGIDHSGPTDADAEAGSVPSPAPSAADTSTARPAAAPMAEAEPVPGPPSAGTDSADWQRSSPFDFGDSQPDTGRPPAPTPAPTTDEPMAPDGADLLPPVDYLSTDAGPAAQSDLSPRQDDPDSLFEGDTSVPPTGIDHDREPGARTEGLPSVFDPESPSAFDQSRPGPFGDTQPGGVNDERPGSPDESRPGGFEEAVPSGARFDAGVDALLAGATGSLPGDDDRYRRPEVTDPESLDTDDHETDRSLWPDQPVIGSETGPDGDGAPVADRFGWPVEPAGSAPSSLFGQTSDLTPARLSDSDRLPGGGTLRRRERGASKVPVGEGRPVAASSRSPEEVRNLLSRYRNGLRRGGKRLTGSTDPDPGGDGNTRDQHQPNDERR